ncbi:phage BR0599 family protein [Pseudomonas paralcaligenes]|uniref:phage BR0599 family protein n=1 Tax=Pseudomonas paralcaligenes TaxID=2772558 RepID=UPI001C818413|nr:phage BR0599 family protein [Pseudomonas paralcaligenes]HBO4355109.1 phage BR0599 family protein [Pseudomonas aeruginosa]
MSHSARESSIAAGEPIRLYKFRRGVLVWLYTSAAFDIPIGSEIYRTVRGGITDDGIRRTGELSADRLKVTAPAGLDVAQLYRGVPPSAEIELIIYDAHFGEAQAEVAWWGSIESVRWPALDRCEISGLTLLATLDVPGLRLTWERNCGAALFDRHCKVNRDLWRVELAIQSRTGEALSSGGAVAYGDGWFSGGFVEWPVGAGEYDRRAIEHHQGSTLQILGGTSGIPNSVRAYPGCARTAQVCKDKFNNLLNLRCDPNLMGTNPFDGDPVF